MVLDGHAYGLQGSDVGYLSTNRMGWHEPCLRNFKSSKELHSNPNMKLCKTKRDDDAESNISALDFMYTLSTCVSFTLASLGGLSWYLPVIQTSVE
jgi:hypothetical protein